MIARMLSSDVRPRGSIYPMGPERFDAGFARKSADQYGVFAVQLIKGYRAPRITYVEDDDNDPTRKMPALAGNPSTLIPTIEEPVAEAASWRGVWLAVAAFVAIAVFVVADRTVPRTHSLGMDHSGRKPSTEGVLIGPASRAGETVFVDDQARGVVPAAVTVSCGTRRVRIGKSGAVRVLDVPCGGSLEL